MKIGKFEFFFIWIDLNNEILKIKWVNKYMIICGLRDWKIIRRRIACLWILDLRQCVGVAKNKMICNCEKGGSGIN